MNSGAAARVVTVDGTAGSGKSTLGRRLALALALPLIDTGLFYRGVMVAAVASGLDPRDSDGAAALAQRTQIEVNTDPGATEGGWQLRVDGVDPGELARDPRLATLLSTLSAIPGVRAAILTQQRRPAQRCGAVAVGRDCGTVVFPDAMVKFYLWAAPEVRAHRRALQLAAAGTGIDEAALSDEIAGRDALDRDRAASPLRPAADAHMIDTGTVSVTAMVAEAVALCRARGLAVPGGLAGEPV
ncbi:MAG TPA: (d)CMP kinase [Candidatus Dormibacteraeota bacterium]